MISERLLLVSGKGGVGKSALACALAIYAQRQGQRVLLIDVGAGGGVATHLGVGPLGFTSTEIRPGLWALAVDRSKALIEYLKVQVGVPGLATFGPAARAFDALAATAPGIREIVTLGKVLWEVREEHYDLVVADCPPTGQIFGLLRAPSTIAELVPSGRIRQQAEWMAGLLLDPAATRLILISLAEELPTIETEETLAQLGQEKVIGAVELVANRILPRLATDALGSGAAAEAAALHRSLWEEQQQWLERLPPDRTLPFLFGLLTPGEVAARLADAWEVPGA
ncbi:MAG TPA: ArsA family ATPase [Acidimicrobiia bacterium]|nr:ArsA family ATPase [Acidimicrobiia bacterium]